MRNSGHGSVAPSSRLLGRSPGAVGAPDTRRGPLRPCRDSAIGRLGLLPVLVPGDRTRSCELATRSDNACPSRLPLLAVARRAAGGLVSRSEGHTQLVTTGQVVGALTRVLRRARSSPGAGEVTLATIDSLTLPTTAVSPSGAIASKPLEASMRTTREGGFSYELWG